VVMGTLLPRRNLRHCQKRFSLCVLVSDVRFDDEANAKSNLGSHVGAAQGRSVDVG
jgi:hypothetical protein